MADFPLVGNMTLCESIGFDTSTSGGTVITSASSGDSAWVELAASTSLNSDVLELVIIRNGSGNIGIFRLDIAVGAIGSEVEILSDLLLSGKPSGQTSDYQVNIPIGIPSGSRISARCYFSSATRAIELGARLWSGQFKSPQPLSSSISYGFNGFDGVDVDPGGTLNTKGAWFEVDPAISDSINGFYLGLGDSSNNAQATVRWLIDIAIGTGGSEVIIAENISSRGTTGEMIKPPVFVNTTITSGQRVSIRCQSNIIDATDRVLSASITGFI